MSACYVHCGARRAPFPESGKQRRQWKTESNRPRPAKGATGSATLAAYAKTSAQRHFLKPERVSRFLPVNRRREIADLYLLIRTLCRRQLLPTDRAQSGGNARAQTR